MSEMNLTKKCLEDAIAYFQDIIDNPDRVIKIEPSFESQYIRAVMEGRIKPQSQP